MFEKVKKFGQHCSTLWNQYLPSFELFIQLNRRYIVGQNIEPGTSVKVKKVLVNTVRHFEISKIGTVSFNYLLDSTEDILSVKTSEPDMGEEVKKFGQHCSTLRKSVPP